VFGQRFNVLCPKYWGYGVPRLIDVGENPPVGLCQLRLTRTGVVVVEMWGEVPPLGEIRWISQ